MAETVAAAVLALSAGYIALNETFRQLAGDLAVRRFPRPCAYSGAGAGRARLRIRQPAASAERSVLCSTMPNPAAASATRHQHDRRPQQIEQARPTSATRAEHLVIEQHDRQTERAAQPGLQARPDRPVPRSDSRSPCSGCRAPRRPTGRRRSGANWSGVRWAGTAGGALKHDPENPVPDLSPYESRFSDKIMLKSTI